MPIDNPRAFLRDLFEVAVAAARPESVIKNHLPVKPKGRVIVVGAGKAAAAMAHAFEEVVSEAWGMTVPGLVITPYGHKLLTRSIEVVEAGHPVPDAAGVEAAQRMLHLVHGLSADDLVVALISGGGSALLTLPAEGLCLEDKQEITRALLSCGASISDINCVRKRLSSLKGGRLALAAFPARVHSLIISDVPGDVLSDIASGPTVPDITTHASARAVLTKYHIKVPPAVAQHLEYSDDSVQVDDPRYGRVSAKIIASPQISLLAAAQVAQARGVHPIILGSALEGEARVMGTVMAGIAAQVQQFGQPMPPPCVLLSGGETTVTVQGTGVGGRNVEFLLGLALGLKGAAHISALAADTDGIDGGCAVAGAFVTSDTLTRAARLGLNPWNYLSNNDAHSFFNILGDQLVTGPTHTNVNDFRAVLIDA